MHMWRMPERTLAFFAGASVEAARAVGEYLRSAWRGALDRLQVEAAVLGKWGNASALARAATMRAQPAGCVVRGGIGGA